MLDDIPRVSDSVGLRQSWEHSILNKFPDDADAPGLGFHPLRTTALGHEQSKMDFKQGRDVIKFTFYKGSFGLFVGWFGMGQDWRQ